MAAALMLLFGGVLTIVLGVIFNGYMLSVLWGWFMVPTFGLPELSIPAAMGIALILSTFTGTIDKKSSTTGGGLGTGIALLFSRPLVLLGWGWFLTLFM